MLSKAVGAIMLLVGVLLLFNAFPLVTLYVDSSPPVIYSTVPKDGGVYASLADFIVQAGDPNSGIQKVELYLPSRSGSWYTLNLVSGTIYNGTWSITLDPFEIPGTYSFTFRVTNNAGLQTSVTGSFTIYTAITGDWYVNGRKISSPTDTIYATNRTVHFKFVRTGGTAPDYMVSVKVFWKVLSGPAYDEGSITLSKTGSNTWEGTRTFPFDGKWNVTCVASDGRTSVVMAITSLDFTGSREAPAIPLSPTQMLGAVLAVAGAVLLSRRD
jgi:hypothetical protein